jgi:hypothetical protein
MTAERILRAASIALGVVALIDPAFRQDRTQPIAVRVQPASATAADRDLADRVRQRLASGLEDRADTVSSETPDAVVIAGEPTDWSSITDGIPVSIVTDAGPNARNVRVVDVAAPTRMFPGVPAPVVITVAGRELVGESTRISLHLEGVEIDAIDHKWTRADETLTAQLEYLPPSAGRRQLRVSASAAGGEATESDNRVDLAIDVVERKLRVLVHEPRPSWQGTFVRRALEEDPLFEVSGLARTSKGIAVRTGEPPERLVAANLEGFDAIVVGAPEELRDSDVTALEWYLRTRGGAVILVPDRRPSGPYVRMIPAAAFQEVLIDSAAVLRGDAGALRGSEFALPDKIAPGVDVMAGLTRNSGTRPVVIGWPEGLGRAIFSGALDAWRHRSRPEEFTAFWRVRILSAAAQSPAPLEVTVAPTVARVGDHLRLAVRLRPTEFARGPRTGVLPELAAVAQTADGSRVPVRLWPTAEPGTYEGAFDVTSAGRVAVEVTAGARLASRAELMGADAAREAAGPRSAAIDLFARATGGTVADVSDLSDIESHLRGLQQRSGPETIRPARSPYWVAAFVVLVGAEWFLRRRRGLS